MNNSDLQIVQKREQVVNDLIQSVGTSHWRFQKQVDAKARSHLKNLLIDCWIKSTDRSSTTTVSDVGLGEELDKTVSRVYRDVLFEYKKWCCVTGQSRLSKKSDSIRELIAAVLLLLMIFGEVDLVRTQNHVIQMLFHVALRIAFSPENKTKLDDLSQNNEEEEDVNQPSDANTPSIFITSAYESIRLSAANSCRQRQRPALQELSFDDLSKVTSVGGIVRREARLIYNLLSLMFDVNKRNDQFFDWDDVNDLCWTSGFVKKFIAQQDGDIGGFQKALRLDEYPLIQQIAGMSQDETTQFLKTDEANIKDLDKQRTKFIQRWKTYFDRAGGVLGWRGYLTFFLNWSAPIYYQLVCLAISLGLLFLNKFMDFSNSHGVVYAAIAGSPLAVLIFYVLLKHVIFMFWTSPSMFHAHRFTIPRRDTKYRRMEMKKGCFWLTDMISGYFLSFFHFHHFMSVLLVLCLSVTYIAAMTWVLFYPIRGVTVDAIELIISMAKGKLKTSTLTGVDWANLVVSYFAFVLLWVSTLFVCFILPSILLQIWVGIFGFIKGWRLKVNRVTSWSDLKRCFNDKKLILNNFRKKMMAENSKDHDNDDLVECSFATVWNAIVEDFYENHELSKSERDRMSFKIRADGKRLVVTKRPDLTARPVNSIVRHHLIKFVNNLYMGSMPCKNIRVLEMKRLCIFTPIFKEKIFYSWEELVKPGNTDASFLQTLIIKFPEDWKNFKDKEFPSGNRLRKTIDYIEAKVLAGIDITSHKIHATYTTHFMKSMIRSWASQRFQPVSRTVRGFMKLPKALSILLRLQNPELTDDQVKAVIRQKFSYVCGAQLYEKKMWKQSTKHSDLSEAAKKINNQEHREYVEGLDELCKSIGDKMLKIAFLKQQKVGAKKTTRYTSVLRCYNGDVTEDLYEISSFGTFSKCGQGKPTNQGFMMQWFDGSFCQTIDCNMDNTLCQSFFIPNLLQEFEKDSRVKMVGFPEYITTKYWSKAGFAAGFTERVFGSIIQRVWSMIGLRFHYGHPDVIRGVYAMFTSGLSKLSYISEDIFSGFDCLLNNGKSMHVDYMEVGKARDVCMVSTTKFNRKIAGGGAQIACSRYAYWIQSSRHLIFTDKLLFSYSVIAHYANPLITIAAAFVLYFARDIVLLATWIVSKHLPVEADSVFGFSVVQVSKHLSLFSDSLLLLQIGMALSVPGILQNILDRGIVRGVFEYLANFVFLVTYSVFQLMNTCFYFHYGFNQSAKYIASGRVTGLQHTSIVDTWRTFKNTHFIPAGWMILLQILSLITVRNWGFLVYHATLVFIWLFSPFLFNTGSLPWDVSVAIWKKLYADDLFRVKIWIRNNCKIDHVDQIIKNNKLQKYLDLEYENVIDDQDNVELDLEMSLFDHASSHAVSTRRHKSVRFFSFDQLQSNIHTRKLESSSDLVYNDKKEKKKNKKSKQEAQETITPSPMSTDLLEQPLLEEEPISDIKLVKYGFRRKFLFFVCGQPVRILRYLLFLIPKLLLLLILYGTKLLSYLILLYKVIAPWTSPPDYLESYKTQFEKRISESRIMNVQRLLGRMGSDNGQIPKEPAMPYTDARKRRTNTSIGFLSRQVSSSGATGSGLDLGFTEKDIQSKLENIGNSDFTTYQRLLQFSSDIAKENSSSERAALYQAAVKHMKSARFGLSQNAALRDLCDQCCSLTFYPIESSEKDMINVMSNLSLFFELYTFTRKVNKMISRVDRILKSDAPNKFEKATESIVKVGHFIFLTKRRQLVQIMISDNPERRKVSKLCNDLLIMLVGQICKVAERRMIEAKSHFKTYSVQEQQNILFNLNTSDRRSMNFERCQKCKLSAELTKVQFIMQQALNFAIRLNEEKGKDKSNSYTMNVFPSDNAQSLFDQIFPLYPEGTSLDKFEMANSSVQNKGMLYDSLYQCLTEHLNAKTFSDLEDECSDLWAYLEKRSKELACSECTPDYEAQQHPPIQILSPDASDSECSDIA